MSRKKKKRFSRKFRKLHKISKPSTSTVPGNPIVEKISGVAKQHKEDTQTKPQERTFFFKETAALESQKKSLKNEKHLQFNETKSREIIGNLRTVLVVSVVCLLLLGILYYIELQVDWIATINTKINNTMNGWDW